MRVNIKFILIFLFGLFIKEDIDAASVDTLSVSSRYMSMDIEVLVISPSQEFESKQVIYLLHGYGGNAHQWLTIKPDLPELADRYNITFVCPDGLNSWYIDSPMCKKSKYESFFIKELLPAVVSQYNLPIARELNAITGLSMGGHGAFWYALNYPERFGAVGSMSGGVDLRPFKDSWNLSLILGDYGDGTTWDKYMITSQLDKVKRANLAILFDCGYEDFFFDVNVQMHQKLLDLKVPHDFTVRPGGHNSTYWSNAIDYQIVFFSNFFRGE